MSGYPFVHAYNDYGRRAGPVLAFAIHMAEGGGTVGFLSRPNVRGVSVHYVIEYSGRIVQMLLESHASGSINPNDIRTTDGPEPYGATPRKRVMGSWDSNPNAAVLSVEIEGFALQGPNVAQHTALVRLVDDIRGRYPRIGLLGHRDWADYKRCPGAHIEWDRLGGHGEAAEAGEAMSIYTRTVESGRFIIKAGTEPRGYKPVADGWVVAKTWDARATDSSGPYVASLARISGSSTPSSLIEVPPDGGFFAGLYISTAEVEEEADPPPPNPDCAAEVEAAIVADRALAHVEWT